MRRIILFSYFLFISLFCFAQQSLPSKIVGGIPSANSGKIYQIQVGAFKFDVNAQDAVSRLKNIDLQPVTEKFRDLTRVLIKGIPASQIRSVLSSVAKAGFREVIVREDSPSNAAYGDAPPVRQENTYTPPKQETKKPPDIICRTWTVEKCPNLELIGSRFFILDDGTYYVTNAKGESSSLSEWRRNHGSEFEYSHNGWEYYGKAEIINLTDNSFELIDSGYSYDNPGNTSAGYSNLWIFSRAPDEPAEK